MSESMHERPTTHNEEKLYEARFIFTEHFYPQLFGDEEMGDAARTFTPSEITAILAQYEDYLKASGLINVNEGE